MSENQMVALEGENIVNKLASSFPEDEQKVMARDIFLAMQMKSVGVGDKKRRFSAYEALSYVMACHELDLNPVLNHVIMLEDQFYITLQGHLQNAHKSGQLVGLATELVSVEEVEVMKRDWDLKKDVPVRVKQFRYKCTILKKMALGDISEFSAIGISDKTNVTGGDKKSEIAIEQMAEARAMRRTLSRAFPVGLGNYEDVIDSQEIGAKIGEERSEAGNAAGKLMAAKKPKAVPEEPKKEPEPVAPASEPQTEEPAEETVAEVEPEIVEMEIEAELEASVWTSAIQRSEEPTLERLTEKVMVAKVEFNRALSNHRLDPTPENETIKTNAAAAVVKLNRAIIALENGG